MAKRWHGPSLDQAHPVWSALDPLCEPLPRKLGAPTELVGDGLKQVFEDAARSRVGTHPVEQDDLPARLEDTRKLIERYLGMGHGVDDVLRHHDIERSIGKIQALGVHNSETLDIVESPPGDTATRLQQHVRGEIDSEHAAALGIIGQRNSSADADLEDTSANAFAGCNRRPSTSFEYRAEHQIIDGRPSRIDLGDSVSVDIGGHHVSRSSPISGSTLFGDTNARYGHVTHRPAALSGLTRTPLALPGR